MVQKPKMIKLENWSVVVRDQCPWQAPESAKRQLSGECYNHPQFKDGTFVSTSYIVDVDKNVIKTYSGSIYELGEPDPEYLKWLDENGYKLDPQNPIKVIENSNVLLN